MDFGGGENGGKDETGNIHPYVTGSRSVRMVGCEMVCGLLAGPHFCVEYVELLPSRCGPGAWLMLVSSILRPIAQKITKHTINEDFYQGADVHLRLLGLHVVVCWLLQLYFLKEACRTCQKMMPCSLKPQCPSPGTMCGNAGI